MKEEQFIINVLEEKYSEYLEMEGINSSSFLLNVITKLYIQERDKAAFYKKLAYEKWESLK